MKVDWDETKDAINVGKHGIRFKDAVLAFDDPYQMMVFDQYVDGEARWQTIGQVNGLLLLLVVHTYEGDDAEEFARIISAREVVAYERRLYEEGV